MYESLFIVGIVCAVMAGGFLIATVAMFFGFNIPALRKDVSGILEQKQIEEIRRSNSGTSNRHNGVNVFEELEKKAKVKKNNTHSLNVGPTAEHVNHSANGPGTSVLRRANRPANPNFIIEKDIMFVSTNEVI